MTVRARPVGPRLLVKPIEATEATAKGIVLPDSVRSKECRGIVHSVGDGWYRELSEDGPVHTPLPMRPGDVVIYDRSEGTRVSLDLNENGTFEDFIVLHVHDVLLRLEDVPSRPPVHA